MEQTNLPIPTLAELIDQYDNGEFEGVKDSMIVRVYFTEARRKADTFGWITLQEIKAYNEFRKQFKKAELDSLWSR